MNSISLKFTPRKWQKKAFKTIDTNVATGLKHIIPVNASVGSGKTVVAEYALGKYIISHEAEKTVQMFITPRIRLCDQQFTSIVNFLEMQFSLKEGNDYKLIPVDCRKSEFCKKNDSLTAKHVIFVICDESLWGTDSKTKDPMLRWHSWIHKFKVWSKVYKFGYCILDEAHNYENNAKLIRDLEEDCLFNWFNIMPMSGTPSAFQKAWSKEAGIKRNVCNYSVKAAIEDKCICKPTLNLVHGDSSSDMLSAIYAILNKEKCICKSENFPSHILVNFNGIDDIKQFIDNSWIRLHAGKEFHVITLHSNKQYSDDNMISVTKPTVDCKETDTVKVNEVLDALDDNSYFKDDLPVIVCQVKMIGEGINISSFNSVLTTTNSDITAMQQIGRAIRNYKYNEKTKLDNGHANVYIMYDNECSVADLLFNLSRSYNLTDDCFVWGDKIDITTSSGYELDENSIPELNVNKWMPIHDIEINEIVFNLEKKSSKKYQYDMRNAISNDKQICEAFDYIISANSDILKYLGISKSKPKVQSTAKTDNKTDNVKVLQANDKSEKKAKDKKKEKYNTVNQITKLLHKIYNVISNQLLVKECWKTGKEGKRAILNYVFQDNNEILTNFFLRYTKLLKYIDDIIK